MQLGGNILCPEIHKFTFGNKEEFSKQWKECAWKKGYKIDHISYWIISLSALFLYNILASVLHTKVNSVPKLNYWNDQYVFWYSIVM
jgi:hypothetical protein